MQRGEPRVVEIFDDDDDEPTGNSATQKGTNNTSASSNDADKPRMVPVPLPTGEDSDDEEIPTVDNFIRRNKIKVGDEKERQEQEEAEKKMKEMQQEAEKNHPMYSPFNTTAILAETEKIKQEELLSQPKWKQSRGDAPKMDDSDPNAPPSLQKYEKHSTNAT
jgi:hypothetical protein